jgi:hypothetical protein
MNTVSLVRTALAMFISLSGPDFSYTGDSLPCKYFHQGDWNPETGCTIKIMVQEWTYGLLAIK